MDEQSSACSTSNYINKEKEKRIKNGMEIFERAVSSLLGKYLYVTTGTVIDESSLKAVYVYIQSVYLMLFINFPSLTPNAPSFDILW